MSRSRPALQAPSTLFADIPAYLVPQVLSDGSTVYNVNSTVDGVIVTFYCVDQEHAERLVSALNDCVGALRL